VRLHGKRGDDLRELDTARHSVEHPGEHVRARRCKELWGICESGSSKEKSVLSSGIEVDGPRFHGDVPVAAEYALVGIRGVVRAHNERVLGRARHILGCASVRSVWKQ
jgi:hypothetical protein